MICLERSLFFIPLYLCDITPWSSSASSSTCAIRGPEDLSATWHERSHAIMLHWACWKRMWLRSRQERRGLDFPCSCSNLASRGGIQTGQTQIWQRRHPQANHVKVRTACRVGPPPSTSPSSKLSVTPMVDSVAWLFLASVKNPSQPGPRRDGTERYKESSNLNE